MAVASLSRFHLPTLAHLTSLHRLSLRPPIHTPPKPFSTLILAPRPSPTLPRAHAQETLAGPAAKPPDSAAGDGGGGGEEEIVEIPIDRLFVPPETEVSLDVRARVLKGSNIVLSKYARDSRVLQAEYVKSSVATEDCPGDGLPEFALVGRSNVGKSSLLNSLVRRKKLALTSKTPGKTQCINHFRINDSWYIVDLPGYGYASAPLEVKKDWVKFTKDYFLNRSTLVSVFLLIDATIPAKKIDLDYASWLGQNKIPMTLVFTKCDKRKKKRKGGRKPQENVLAFQELIRESFEAAPPWIMTSSITNQGRDEILLHMAQLRNYWLKH